MLHFTTALISNDGDLDTFTAFGIDQADATENALRMIAKAVCVDYEDDDTENWPFKTAAKDMDEETLKLNIEEYDLRYIDYYLQGADNFYTFTQMGEVK